MTEIRNNQDSSTVCRYPSAMDTLQFSKWRTLLCSLDKRVELSDDIISFIRILSPTDRNKLYNYLKLFILSAHGVENTLKLKWSIPQVANKIEILISLKLHAFGHFNNASAKDGLIQVIIGNPKEYDRFFAISTVIYAHELGHMLFEYDKKGKLPWSKGMSTATYFKDLQFALSQDGKLERKYLEDIPFCLLPKELLFQGKATATGLLSIITELIADKVSLQLCGYKEARGSIRSKINDSLDTKNPWGRLFLIVLAREFKLNHEEEVLCKRLAELDCPWESSISTEELLNKMSEFFRQVSLKHQ